MSDKYVCPQCGSEIEYWEEFFFDKRRKIDSKTGQCGKLTKTKPQVSDLHGFKCTECDWFINRDECSEDFEVLYQMISEPKSSK